MKRFLMITAALMIAAAPAVADIVRVECIGEVEFTQVSFGEFADVISGDPVIATWLVDSEDYMDHPTFGVRAYPLILGSMEVTIGSVGPIAMVDPQPFGRTAYFNMRNADPVADGFFLDCNTDYDVWPVQIMVPANIDPYFGFKWTIGYEGDTFDSLDIVDAVGTYDFTGLTSFYTGLMDAFADAMGFIPSQTIISIETVATEEASWGSVKSLFR